CNARPETPADRAQTSSVVRWRQVEVRSETETHEAALQRAQSKLSERVAQLLLSQTTPQQPRAYDWDASEPKWAPSARFALLRVRFERPQWNESAAGGPFGDSV